MMVYDRLLRQNARAWFLLYISSPETYSNEQSAFIPQRHSVGEHLFWAVFSDKIEIKIKILVNHLISRVILTAVLPFIRTSCLLYIPWEVGPARLRQPLTDRTWSV